VKYLFKKSNVILSKTLFYCSNWCTIL